MRPLTTDRLCRVSGCCDTASTSYASTYRKMVETCWCAQIQTSSLFLHKQQQQAFAHLQRVHTSAVTTTNVWLITNSHAVQGCCSHGPCFASSSMIKTTLMQIVLFNAQRCMTCRLGTHPGAKSIDAFYIMPAEGPIVPIRRLCLACQRWLFTWVCGHD